MLHELGEESRQLDRLALRSHALVQAGEDEQIVDQALHAGQLAPGELLDVAHPLGGEVRFARQDLELTAYRGQRGAQLVRGVGDELALAREGVLEPIQHVVEGLREHPDLVTRALRCDSVGEIAGIDSGCDPGHATQGHRGPGGDEVGRDQDAGERQRAGDRERPRHPGLRPLDGLQRLTDAGHGDRATVCRDRLGQQPDLAGVDEFERRIPVGRCQQLLRLGRLALARPGSLPPRARPPGRAARARSSRSRPRAQ